MWQPGWILGNGDKKVQVWIKCETRPNGGGDRTIVVNAQHRALVKYHVSPEARVYDARPEALLLRPGAPTSLKTEGLAEGGGGGGTDENPGWRQYAATVPDFFLAGSDDDEDDGSAAADDDNPTRRVPGKLAPRTPEKLAPRTAALVRPKTVKTEPVAPHVKAEQEEDGNGDRRAQHEKSRAGSEGVPARAGAGTSILAGTSLGKRRRPPAGGGGSGHEGYGSAERPGSGAGGFDTSHKRPRETSESQAPTATATSGEQHREEARALIRSFTDAAIVGWTDGSSRGNPGPAGAGAVVCAPGDDRPGRLAGRTALLSTCEAGDPRCGVWVQGWHALGRATNNVGELEALDLALEIAAEARRTHAHLRSSPIHLVPDSQYSRSVLGPNRAVKNAALVKAIKARVASERATVHWVKGHAGIPGNVLADALAGSASEVSRRDMRDAESHSREFRRTKTVANVDPPAKAV